MKSKQLNYSQLISLVLAESRGAWKRMAFFILCIAIGAVSYTHLTLPTIYSV